MVVVIRKGLKLNIPVVLVNTINGSEERISLRQRCKYCKGYVGYKKYCRSCGKELQNYEILKSYRDRILTEEQLRGLNEKSENLTLEILGFKRIGKDELVSLLITAKKSYVVLADDTKKARRISQKGFYALRDAIAKQKVLGICKLIQRFREHLAILFSFRGRLMLVEIAFPETYNTDEIKRREENADKVDYKKLVKDAEEFVKENTNGFKIEEVKNTRKKEIEKIVKGKKEIKEKEIEVEANPFK